MEGCKVEGVQCSAIELIKAVVMHLRKWMKCSRESIPWGSVPQPETKFQYSCHAIRKLTHGGYLVYEKVIFSSGSNNSSNILDICDAQAVTVCHMPALDK